MKSVRRVVVGLLAVVVAGAGAFAPAHAAAPGVRPWTPASFDSLQTWSTAARVMFREQATDPIDSVTIEPYNRVGSIAMRWFQGLGRDHMPEARTIESALDSLGFDTEVVLDDKLPAFALLVVRNPFRTSASAMGFMYWFRGTRLFEQGVEMRGGLDPIMKVWWNDNQAAPYEWAIADRGRDGTHRFFLFRLSADGGIWQPGQYEGEGPDLANAHTVSFEDVNGDGLPELVTWSPAAPDTLFEACTSCPSRVIERIYTERGGLGFQLHDSRMVPAPYSIFMLFVHLLISHNREAAARLLDDPALLGTALGMGWGTRHSPGTWLLEGGENQHWPEWLQFRFRGPRGVEHYVVRFTQKDGRWILKSWKHAAISTGPNPTPLPGPAATSTHPAAGSHHPAQAPHRPARRAH